MYPLQAFSAAELIKTQHNKWRLLHQYSSNIKVISYIFCTGTQLIFKGHAITCWKVLIQINDLYGTVGMTPNRQNYMANWLILITCRTKTLLVMNTIGEYIHILVSTNVSSVACWIDKFFQSYLNFERGNEVAKPADNNEDQSTCLQYQCTFTWFKHFQISGNIWHWYNN